MLELTTRFICEYCRTPIDPQEYREAAGIIVQGNIYRVDLDIEDRPGLIGNSFPEPDEAGRISVDAIDEHAYHVSCLRDLLISSSGEWIDSDGK